MMGFLDLIGVLTIGVIGTLSVNGIQSKGPGPRVEEILSILGLSNLAFQKQVAILGVLASILLISRTIFSVLIIRKTMFFLSRRSSEISSQLIKKLLGRDILFIRERSTQETLFALTTGVSLVTTGVIGSLVSLIADLTLIIVLASGLLFLDIQIAISTFLLFGSIGIYLYFRLHKKAEVLAVESTQLTINSNEKLLQVIDSYREMIVRNRRYYFAYEISKIRYKISDVSAELAFLPNVSKYTIEAATIVGILLISASQFLLQDATHAVSALSVFLIASARIAPAVLRMQQCAIQIKSSTAASLLTFDFIERLNKFDEIQDPGDKLDFEHEKFSPTIELKNVTFSYPNNLSESISNINLEISKGQQVAIVGASGAGKTTMIDLLLGIITPSSGEIQISNKSPENAISLWPGAIAYVPQDIKIVSGSILENIILGYAMDSLNSFQLERAIELSNLSDFIKSLPDGVQNQVGEFGNRLSGGQKQRLALARALYSNPRIIILDEATSSLDAESEFAISQALKGLKGDYTVVIIAHRLSTVREADKVVYLENGKIVAQGTFSEVRATSTNFDAQANLMGL
jgi:ABC-type multidrug transport system fused ATPase/permease subunit